MGVFALCLTSWRVFEMEAHPSGCGSSLSLRHGVRCVPEASVSVEEVLVAIGEEVEYSNIVSASWMNKAVVIFLKEWNLSRLVESGIRVSVYTVLFSAGGSIEPYNNLELSPFHTKS